jgi:hypothetical protein
MVAVVGVHFFGSFSIRDGKSTVLMRSMIERFNRVNERSTAELAENARTPWLGGLSSEKFLITMKKAQFNQFNGLLSAQVQTSRESTREILGWRGEKFIISPKINQILGRGVGISSADEAWQAAARLADILRSWCELRMDGTNFRRKTKMRSIAPSVTTRTAARTPQTRAATGNGASFPGTIAELGGRSHGL